MTAFLPFRRRSICELSHRSGHQIGQQSCPCRSQTRSAASIRSLPGKSPLIARRFTPLRGRRQVSVSPRLTAAALDRLTLASGAASHRSRSGRSMNSRQAPSPRSRKPSAVERPPAASAPAAASASAAAPHPVRGPDEPRSVAGAARPAGSRQAAHWELEL